MRITMSSLSLAICACLAVTAMTFAAAGGAGTAYAAAAKNCGSMPAPSAPAEYRFKVTKGSVTCKTARAVLKRFLRTNRTTKGWDCRNGARETPWTAACGSPYHSLYDTFRDRDFKKVIKAYYRLDP
jgi:hypothetical protein